MFLADCKKSDNDDKADIMGIAENHPSRDT